MPFASASALAWRASVISPRPLRSSRSSTRKWTHITASSGGGSSSSSSSSGGGGGDDASASSSSSSSSLVPDTMPVAGPDTDWRTFRARLAAMEPAAGGGSADGGGGGGAGPAAAAFSDARWAHALPVPEAGAVLLAHPSMFASSQTYFRRAAILMLEVGDGGALGVILNRPTEHTLGSVQFAGDADGGLIRPFRGNKLWLGGDVGESSIIVVTSSPAVADATEVAAGLRVCSISAAAAAVEAGRAAPDDFRFFARYSGWGPGQLQRECRAGVWIVAAASAGLALDAGPAAAGPELWHQILTTMGGPYQELSQLIKEGESKLPQDRPSPPGDEAA